MSININNGMPVKPGRLRLPVCLSLLYSASLLLYIISMLVRSEPAIDLLTATLVTATLLLSMVYMKNFFALLAVGLLLMGAWNLHSAGTPYQDWLFIITEKLDLFCLVLALRFFEFPITLGRYDLHVTNYALQKVKTGCQFFTLASLVTYIFGIASGYASIQIIFSTLKEKCTVLFSQSEEFLTAIIKRSVGLSQMLSPLCPTLALVLVYSNISWINYSLYGLLLSGAGLGVSLLVSFYLSPSFRAIGNIKLRETESTQPVSLARIRQFLLAMALILTLVVGLEALTGWSMLIILFAASIVVPPVWATLIGKAGGFIRRAAAYLGGDAANQATIFTLIISAGFFSGSLPAGPPGMPASTVQLIQEQTWIVSMLIPLSIILLTLLGVNSFIGVAIVGGTITLLPVELEPAALAVTLISGAVIANIISPFSVSSLMMANLTGKTPFTVGFRWNGIFSLGLLLSAVMLGILFL